MGLLVRGYRKLISSGLEEQTGHPPHCWQLDVAEAVFLGLDVFLIAETGAGKTWTFVGALLANETKKKKLIVVSPLNELQKDQVSTLLSFLLDIPSISYPLNAHY